MHLSVFHSVQLVFYSKTKIKTYLRARGAQSSLCILRIGRIGSGWWQHKAVRWLFIMRDWFSCQSENTANLSLIKNLCHCLKIVKHRCEPKPCRKSVWKNKQLGPNQMWMFQMSAVSKAIAILYNYQLLNLIFFLTGETSYPKGCL